MTGPTYVVAGNGTSIAHPTAGSILASDFMVRSNNFFFEPQSFLGRRVDLAVMGGDPRVAPFMFETLWQCRGTYDLRAWTSHNPAVIRAGRRRFGALFQPLCYGDDGLAAQVQGLIACYGCKPMTGTYAVLAAYGQGAGRIILTGIDFYDSQKRYSYDAGKNQSALLGQDLNYRGLDIRQHNIDLDLEILTLVQEHTGGALRRTTSGSRLDAVMDLAENRQGAGPDIVPTTPPTDWASWAGLYPIAALKLLRRLRRVWGGPKG
ncbi:hypothetical protein EOK75_20600 (plasmid) [Pseudorhodobacter turbinis]|uniref:Alpha-2,3-sialyltransferase (CST-I) n=1 Tax=Pseudorhodobacter turbinis TaxID=2500533 RepID=A0A4P8EM93_9RHOB|nr:alpha-2,3-sialyltransferase [Pseudorhodobacter turbinis]QCO58159.1 hypothetical protein EOK75_20600 [Pseudorhodobacter turbinis]